MAGLTIITERGCCWLQDDLPYLFMDCMAEYLSTELIEVQIKDVPKIFVITYELTEHIRFAMKCCDMPFCSTALAIEAFADSLFNMIGTTLHIHKGLMIDASFKHMQKLMALVNDGFSFIDAQWLVSNEFVNANKPGNWLVKFPLRRII